MNQNEDIDTTGNWIWEAEEVATYFILKMWANLFEERISLGL